MRKLILLAVLVLASAQTTAQHYVPYDVPAYEPSSNYNSRQAPQYVQTIDNNGPQVQMQRQMERSSRQLDNMNTIRNYELIYGDTYRR